MKLTNVMPTKGNFIAVWQNEYNGFQSEKWWIDDNGVIQYLDSQDGWWLLIWKENFIQIFKFNLW